MSDVSEPKLPEEPHRLEAARLEKLHKIEALGLDPWGQRFDGHVAIANARDKCPAEFGADGETVRVAGRIMLQNDRGKLKFFHVQDATGRIQLMISMKDVPPTTWAAIEQLDLGDLVGVDGRLRITKTGEKTIFVEQLTPLCKSLATPPEKFHGAHDIEMLLRHRYIDMIYNEGVLERLLKRTKIISSIRQTLAGQGYVEAETPVLHAIAGGAAARPFVTHHNALDINLYLRIALELHLKRLMVGGIERVYEIGRVFRNEGIDATHNPEFTMIELYQAYANYEVMMDLCEQIFLDAAKAIGLGSPTLGVGAAEETRPDSESQATSLVIPWGDKTVDLTPPWKRCKYGDLFREHAGCDMHDADAVLAKAKSLHLETKGKHPDVLVNEVFEATVEDALIGPVFVIDYPSSMCPLTKRKRSDPAIAERFELFIHGLEMANAYTELNDPRLQEETFRTQLAGQAEEDSMAKMDHEFVYALKVGMPPAGGMGIGIDRLVMLLTNTNTIRDVIAFPLLKPE